jgi:hypothetical protein
MGYLSNNSTSARAFCQMLQRVWNLKDEEVFIYIGDLRYSENLILYFLDCLEQDLLETITRNTDWVIFKSIINVML